MKHVEGSLPFAVSCEEDQKMIQYSDNESYMTVDPPEAYVAFQGSDNTVELTPVNGKVG